MQATHISCDCQCERTAVADDQWSAPGWFVLQQPAQPHADNDPKLERPLHFATLECLIRWAQAASISLPGLKETARTLSPHGNLSVDTVVGLYI